MLNHVITEIGKDIPNLILQPIVPRLALTEARLNMGF
jgi:hypothetical protein